MKYTIILFLLSTLLLNSCVKDLIIAKEYTIKGYLYKDCSGTPAKNQYIDMFNDKVPSIFGNDEETQAILGSSYTDSTGYFSITYKSKEYGSRNGLVRAANSGGSYLVKDIKIGEVSNLGTVYMGSKYSIVVKINAINRYSNLDTLYVRDLRSYTPSVVVKIVGPFINSELYTATNLTYLENSYDSSNNYVSIGYKINQESWKLHNAVIKPCRINEATIDIK